MMDESQEILQRWVRLGILWNMPPSRRSPDVEQLIVQSMALVSENPRVLVLVASWLWVCWRCVGRDRLKALAAGATPQQQATLGILLESVDGWLSVPVFTGVYSKLPRFRCSEPLLRIDRERPTLRHLIELEATDLSRKWGLLSLPIERKLDAIRPVKWILEENPALRVRSLFKGSLKSSLLAVLDHSGPGVSVTQLARDCAVTRKAVYEAMEDLGFSGMIKDGVVDPGARAAASSYAGRRTCAM